MTELNFTYPAFYRTDGENIYVEIPDLEIEPFVISEEQRCQLVDIAWTLAAHRVEELLRNGLTPPPSRTLEDLEISDDEDRDAFLIELISK